MNYAITIAVLAIFVAAIFGLIRAFKGPTSLDRVLALDYLSIVGLAAVGVLFVITGEPMVLDVGLALALVGFLTALVFGRHLASGGSK